MSSTPLWEVEVGSIVELREEKFPDRIKALALVYRKVISEDKVTLSVAYCLNGLTCDMEFTGEGALHIGVR